MAVPPRFIPRPYVHNSDAGRQRFVSTDVVSISDSVQRRDVNIPITIEWVSLFIAFRKTKWPYCSFSDWACRRATGNDLVKLQNMKTWYILAWLEYQIIKQFRFDHVEIFIKRKNAKRLRMKTDKQKEFVGLTFLTTGVQEMPRNGTSDYILVEIQVTKQQLQKMYDLSKLEHRTYNRTFGAPIITNSFSEDGIDCNRFVIDLLLNIGVLTDPEAINYTIDELYDELSKIQVATPTLTGFHLRQLRQINK